MPSPPSSSDELTDLVARCVLVFERDGASAMDALLVEHALAAPAREQLDALRTAGLLVPQQLPTSIGPYTVLQRLGNGGMGTVFLCEQTTPIRRRVAVKVIRPGMDSREILARFQVERQALALLDHPHIAKILDAGMSADRQPYLAMEYVAGRPITAYCNERALPVRERLRLFVTVCDAVQHAHHKGILHRDLKPSNVLVADRDGAPFPVVIDFGVAKSVTGSVRGETMFTLPGRLLGTPEYMSPEQAGSEGDIDTRTDVYGLGVLLYELLTGTLPIPSSQLDRAADLARALREAEPPTPSARLTSLGNAATSIAADRRTDVPALRRALRGDLDWIVLKAIERDRNRRYGMPAELAADVRRHLADEPVEAARPSATYRLRKYCMRHRLQAISAAIVVLALGAGLTTSLLFYREAAAAELQARASASRLHESLDTALGALDSIVGIGAEGLYRLPQSAQLRSQLARSALELHERLAAAGEPDDPRLSAALASTLARAANLNLLLAQFDPAARLVDRASAVLQRIEQAGRPSPATAQQCAGAHQLCGRLLQQLGDETAAQVHQARALELFEGLPAAVAALPQVRSGRLHALRELADLATANDVAAAEGWLRRARPLADAELEDPSATHDGRFAALKCLARLGWLCIETGAPDSLELTARVRDRARLLAAATDDLPQRIDFADVLTTTINTSIRLGEWESARSDVDFALDVLRKAQREFPDLVQYRGLLARTLQLQATLSDGDVDPTRIDAIDREALQLAEENYRLLGSSPYHGERLVNDLLSYAGNRIEWLADEERYRKTVDLPFVRDVTRRAGAVFEALPPAFRRGRHTRESWLRSYFVRASLFLVDGDAAAARRELDVGVAGCNDLLRDHPGVVQAHLIRGEQLLVLARLCFEAGDVAAGWNAVAVAVADYAVAQQRLGTIPNGWRRTLPASFAAADLLLGRTAPAHVTAAQLAAMARAFAAAESVATGAGYQSSARLGTAALQLLTGAAARGLPARELADAAFDGLRRRDGFPTAQER